MLSGSLSQNFDGKLKCTCLFFQLGYIKLDIPWLSLFQKSILVTLNDVYVLAGPIADRPYDPEREERLNNAIKRQKLEALEQSAILSVG